MAVSGSQSIELLAPQADHLVAVEPGRDLVEEWTGAGPRGDRARSARCRSAGTPTREAAVELAHGQFRWFGGGWKVNAELPGPAGFAGATQFVRPEDVASSIPCGPDVEPIVQSVEEWREAGFTDLALVQIGDEGQTDFLDFAEKELLPALRERGLAD